MDSNKLMEGNFIKKGYIYKGGNRLQQRNGLVDNGHGYVVQKTGDYMIHALGFKRLHVESRLFLACSVIHGSIPCITYLISTLNFCPGFCG